MITRRETELRSGRKPLRTPTTMNESVVGGYTEWGEGVEAPLLVLLSFSLLSPRSSFPSHSRRRCTPAFHFSLSLSLCFVLLYSRFPSLPNQGWGRVPPLAATTHRVHWYSVPSRAVQRSLFLIPLLTRTLPPPRGPLRGDRRVLRPTGLRERHDATG